ncbi:MAG: hypothetical protein AB7N76_06940 [Planctomycetota bacterium]
MHDETDLDPYDPDLGEPSTMELELALRPVKPRVFLGESLDLELSLRNRDEARRFVADPAPGSHSVRFVAQDAAGAERPACGDEEALAARGVPSDPHHEPRDVELGPGEERRSVYDLLPRAGELPAGMWTIRAELPGELAEVEAAVEVTAPPPTPLLARETWEYDQGADSFGLCAWSTSEGEHAGTYLRVRAREDLARTLANRRLSERVAERGLRVAPAATYRARRRHVLWEDGDLTRVVVVDDELPLAEHELPGGALGAWTVADGGLVLVRAEDGELWLERPALEDPAAGWRLSLGAAPDGLAPGSGVLSGWASCFGTLWLAAMGRGGGPLLLAGARVSGGARELLPRHELRLGGEPRWLSARRGPADEEGEQAQVHALLRADSGHAALWRWVPDVDPELLAEGELPVGELRDALLARRLWLLLERNDQAILAALPGVSRHLDSARYAPGWTQLLRLPLAAGGGLYLRGVEGRRFVFEELED